MRGVTYIEILAMNQLLYLLLVFTFLIPSHASSGKDMIESKYFGIIEIDWEEEIYIEKRIDLNGRNNECKLMIEPDIEITNSLADQIDLLEVLDEKSRTLFGKYSDDESDIISSFIEFYLADPAPWLESELNLADGLTREVLLSNLKLVQLHVYAESEGKTLFVLDYSLNPDFTDELLVVVYDSKGNFQKITSES